VVLARWREDGEKVRRRPQGTPREWRDREEKGGRHGLRRRRSISSDLGPPPAQGGSSTSGARSTQRAAHPPVAGTVSPGSRRAARPRRQVGGASREAGS
jgi:hypothetical protein